MALYWNCYSHFANFCHVCQSDLGDGIGEANTILGTSQTYNTIKTEHSLYNGDVISANDADPNRTAICEAYANLRDKVKCVK